MKGGRLHESEIAENLHRADLTPLERSEHIAEWVRLTGEKTAGASCASSLSDGRKAGPQHKPSGINAATRELGIDRTEAQRAVKIDGLSPEAKRAASRRRRDVPLTRRPVVTNSSFVTNGVWQWL